MTVFVAGSSVVRPIRKVIHFPRNESHDPPVSFTIVATVVLGMNQDHDVMKAFPPALAHFFKENTQHVVIYTISYVRISLHPR